MNNALKQGTFSHAYLFTGPRGTGKTSIARILAHEINGLVYNEEQPHLDIIEIDAASNRRIDEIRELKDRALSAPTSAKYKVYIIDEVHMLTKEAFNALLKTLEEPPEHVIFILATTEAHKVPDTIISRTQRFTFKPVSHEKVVAHLKTIAEQENINISDDALALIADHGEGSFRDSISLLDQIRQRQGPIELGHVQQAIGLAPDELLAQLLKVIGSGNIASAAETLGILRSQGVQAPQAAQQLIQVLRTDILKPGPVLPVSRALVLLKQLLGVPASGNPAVALELAVYESVLAASPLSKASSSLAKNEETEIFTENQQPAPSVVIKNYTAASPAPPTSPVVPIETSVSQLPAAAPTDEATKQTSPDLNSHTWGQVLSALKVKHNTLYGIARMAVPEFQAGKLTLTFAFAFHQKRLNDNKNKQILMKLIHEITGKKSSIECIIGTNSKPQDVKPVPKKHEPAPNIDLETISNIFGAAEVVE